MHSIVRDKLREIVALCETQSIDRLWLFGSASGTGERFDAESDIDFVVEIDRDAIPYRGWSDPFFQLMISFEDLLGRRIQLIEWADVRKPSLKDAILEQRELIYEASRAVAAV